MYSYMIPVFTETKQLDGALCWVVVNADVNWWNAKREETNVCQFREEQNKNMTTRIDSTFRFSLGTGKYNTCFLYWNEGNK